jgi:hypothetical protein
MNIFCKVSLIMLMLLFSISSLCALEISKLKYENNVLSYKGEEFNELQTVQGGTWIPYKSQDILSINLVADVLIINTKDAVLEIKTSEIKMIVILKKQHIIQLKF